MKLLLVGDPHVTLDSLEECGKLMEFVYQTAASQKINEIVILGDLHHNHALTRVEVSCFWHRQLELAGDNGLMVRMLVGNHDLPGNAGGDPTAHALVGLEDISIGSQVYDKPFFMKDYEDKTTLGFLPYYFDPQKFVVDANALNADILFCHQTFLGARYSKDFPAPDGVDPADLKCPLIISGHIHMQQILGKVVYVGSPRWLTASDANQTRGIHIFDTETKQFEFISTDKVCRRILAFTVTPENEDEQILADGLTHTIVTLRGPKQWVTKKIEGLHPDLVEHIELRSVYVDDREPAVKESEGIATSLQKYVMSRDWPVSKEQLWHQIVHRVPSLTK